MTDEYLDVVNERDEVVGRAARSEIHARGLWHRAVHVLIHNSRGQLFLQKRSLRKDREPGLWSTSAAGHVDSGEDYDAAILRELKEELGWYPTAPLERVLRIEACRETDQEFVWVYRCAGEGPFALNRDEVETGDWFAPSHIRCWLAERPADFTPAFRLIWSRLHPE
jgi:isopentenyldiphosphate isomerase